MEPANRAQSEVVGVVLLTAVVVLTMAVVGAFVLGAVSETASGYGPIVDAEVTVTATDLTVTHAGGNTVAIGDVQVLLRGDGTAERYDLHAANVTGDGDDDFEPTERFERTHGPTSGSIEVLVIHDPSNTVFRHVHHDLGAGGTVTTATFTDAPDDPEPGESLTFDASGSTGAGGVGSFEWDWDGTVDETTASPTVDHAFASTDGFDVTLTVTDDQGATAATTETIRVDELGAPDDPSGPASGVDYEYHEADDAYASVPQFAAETPTRTGTTDGIDLDPGHAADNVAFRHHAYLDVPENGTYTFSTTSDDGTLLYVHGHPVVDNRGLHAPAEESGEIGLEAGYHNVTVQYFEHYGGETLSASYESENVSKQELPADRLYRSDRGDRSGDDGHGTVLSATGLFRQPT